MDLTRRSLVIAGALLCLSPATRATTARADDSRIYQHGGFALGGTDPVSYFEEGRPRRGSADHRAQWNGAIWLFADERNRDRFLADPEAFAPQYGGWCAWAAARGYAASTTPDAWAIVDGRLYLNYSRRIHRRWEANRESDIRDADANWPNIF